MPQYPQTHQSARAGTVPLEPDVRVANRSASGSPAGSSASSPPGAEEYQRSEFAREDGVACEAAYLQWCELRCGDLTLRALQQFFARYKYLVMSRHIATYKEVGRQLAHRGESSIEALADCVIALIISALKRPATRAGYANALQHISGYLKRDLNKAEKFELSESIEQYRRGVVSLEAPLTLLRAHFQRYPNEYIEQQAFMRACIDEPNQKVQLGE